MMQRALLCALALLALSCPVIQAQEQRRYYLFGYGSLLNTASTEKSNCGLAGFAEGVLDGLRILLQQAATNTNSTADRLLTTLDGCQVQGQRVVRIRGLRRGWYFPSLPPFPYQPYGTSSAFGASQLALGAVRDPNANITGLIYEVNEFAYNQTLIREVGYEVVQISSDSPDITVLGGPALPSGATIAYFGQNASTIVRPSAALPIAYSYIDIWLGGAVELQNRFNLSGPAYAAGTGGRYSSFLEETIKTTSAWSKYIVNDRAYPNRPFVLSQYAYTIDNALYSYLPSTYLRGVRYPGGLQAHQGL